jgi:hypothetical protein
MLEDTIKMLIRGGKVKIIDMHSISIMLTTTVRAFIKKTEVHGGLSREMAMQGYSGLMIEMQGNFSMKRIKAYF